MLKHVAGYLATGILIAALAMTPQHAEYVSQHFIGLSPADIGMSAVDLPPSASSADSAQIDMRGVTAATFITTCTQSTLLGMRFANEDGTDSGVGGPPPFTTVAPAGTVSVISISTGSAATGYNGAAGGAGTLAPSSDVIRLPQRSIKIYFANQGSSDGTCTARAMLAY